MIKKLQLVALGWVVFQGAGLVAMEKNKAMNSPRKEAEMVRALKRSAERTFEKNSRFHGCGTKFIFDPSLAEQLKNDPRIIWLPI